MEADMKGGAVMVNVNKNRKRVLIIDDNWGDLKLMEEALNEAGYDVYVKDRGISGIKVAGALKPHLIILDLHLPDINGILAR
jgi:DNA-binding response OmpR family regulator